VYAVYVSFRDFIDDMRFISVGFVLFSGLCNVNFDVGMLLSRVYRLSRKTIINNCVQGKFEWS
jgi:hypothetical protein